MSPENDQDSVANRAFEQQARSDLRRAVAETDPSVRARLDAMAAAAAAEKPRPARPAWRLAFPVAGGVAAAIVIAVMVGREPLVPEGKSPAAADDLALLLNVDNLDLLEQMEFYLWLDREPGVLNDAASKSLEGQRS